MGKSHDINKHCNILNEPNPNDPRITYLNDGKWLIISSKVICNAKVQQYSIKSPVDSLTLRQGCTAFHGSLVLPPFYNKESMSDLSPSFEKKTNKPKKKTFILKELICRNLLMIIFQKFKRYLNLRNSNLLKKFLSEI